MWFRLPCWSSWARYAAGTVISQSREAGAGVLPDTTISLVVAKAPATAAIDRATGTAPNRAATQLPFVLRGGVPQGRHR